MTTATKTTTRRKTATTTKGKRVRKPKKVFGVTPFTQALVTEYASGLGMPLLQLRFLATRKGEHGGTDYDFEKDFMALTGALPSEI